MNEKSLDLARGMSRFREGLKQAGVKLTQQRLMIFQEVAGSEDHPDAETIFKSIREKAPSISLDTVYRTLWLLVDLDLISSLVALNGRTRFDANRSPHHHFICTECGLTRDFYFEEFDRLKIPEAVESLGQIKKTQVEVRGVCRDCSKKKSGKIRAERGKEAK
jgi:Fur family peroxide stress response transcriptional regulator